MKTSKRVKRLWRRHASWKMSLKDFAREAQWYKFSISDNEAKDCAEWLLRKGP